MLFINCECHQTKVQKMACNRLVLNVSTVALLASYVAVTVLGSSHILSSFSPRYAALVAKVLKPETLLLLFKIAVGSLVISLPIAFISDVQDEAFLREDRNQRLQTV